MIKKICVIGAGVMGAGIAAHIANAGCNVLIMDIVSNDGNRNALVENAIKRIITSEALAHKNLLNFISIGNLEDNLQDISTCDWVIEVIVENLEVKKSLYKKIQPFLQPGAYISSNTSTFPLRELKKSFSGQIRENFYITHFFNPPRYMRLLELVSDEENNKQQKNDLQEFISRRLGKGVVLCNDTPGFIANRVGCFLLEYTVRCAIEFNLEIEVVDNIFEKLLGFPKTGVFGLIDLIGLDVMQMIAKSLISLLPPDDRFHVIYTKIPQIEDMINQGAIGRKAKDGQGGFYRVLKTDQGKVKQVLDLKTWRYKEVGKAKVPMYNNISELLADETNIGLCFKKILVELGIYVCSLIPTVSESVGDIDLAMKLGYNWKYGPFELITKFDNYGFEYLIDNADSFGLSLPSYLLDKRYAYYTNSGEQIKLSPLEKLQAKKEPIIENGSAQLWLLKNNIVCFSINTKMNVLNIEVFELLSESIKYAESQNYPLIIYNELNHFSLGADLRVLLNIKATGNSFKLENFIKLGQSTMQQIKYAKVPVIACAKGYALGGGCELLLHSTHVIANLETCSGLVEVGVGLIPGWGGLKEMILRSGGNLGLLTQNIIKVIEQKKVSSAYQLEDEYQIRNFRLNMNIDLLLEEASAWAGIVHKDFNPRLKPGKVLIPKFTIDTASSDAYNDSHTKYIALQLHTLGSLNEVTEEDLLDFERNLFIELANTEAAQNKIKAVLN